MDDVFYPITDVSISADTLLPSVSGSIEDENGEDGTIVALGDLTEGTETSVLPQTMDITQPLNHLRRLLQLRLGVNLQGYIFTLQDSQQLDPSRNLVDQCVQGEGMVQVRHFDRSSIFTISMFLLFCMVRLLYERPHTELPTSTIQIHNFRQGKYSNH